MTQSLTLDHIFYNARTHNAWLDKPVPASLLRSIYETMRYGPTSANCSPLRIVFIQSKEAKEKLRPCLSEGNIDKTMDAPVTAILADDYNFHDHLPKLFPHTDAQSWFTGNQPLIDATAHRNGTLQAAYFIIAARAWGLDCGPMSGFDQAKVDDLFFQGTNIRSNFLCNLGYGDASQLFDRAPRFEFDDVCHIL